MKRLSEIHKAVLGLVGHFGYLTNREVAELQWPNNPPDSAMVSAQNATARLVDDGLLLARKLDYDNLSRAFVLTSKGAAWLNEEFMEAWLEHDSAQVWFADGYNLSLKGWETRRPLTKLLHQVMASQAGFKPVGQRSLKRDFMGLGAYGNFDAALLNERGELEFGVFLAHASTAVATDKVVELAKGKKAFLVASDREPKLRAMLKWRAQVRPEMSAYIQERLPAGLVA